MKTAGIAQYRLLNQQLSAPAFKTAGEVVRWMGAMQAQDYAGAKWSIGVRLPGSTDAGIEKAVGNKEIIRTWALRGTWHWVAPADVHWMLRMVSPIIQRKYTPHLLKESLDKAAVKKSNNILVKALQDGEVLTREELAEVLKKKGIKASHYGIGHLLLHASQEQLICMGPRRGKQFTHVLLDDWVPKEQRYEPADPLAELALRYYSSHGPATEKDFMWWAGITLGDARKGTAAVKDKLETVVVEGVTYFMPPGLPDLKKNGAVHLLPGFDEYLLGYTDRSAAVDKAHLHKLAMTANGQFSATIVAGGQVRGIWTRTVGTKEVAIETEHFDKTSQAVQQAVGTAARRYAKFLGLKVALE
ncbi:winged helix DNA-binding domain-containing protein [Paraflavitalea soli]|nr:winged helix DNA-binding domain-containing protein [Paraflavitalea soli]